MRMSLDNEKLAEVKHTFNLNLYEAKLWTALLSKGTASAGELSEVSNVPRSRAYDVLESLEKRGFVMAKLGKPINYVAIPPGEVLERVKKEIELEKEAKLRSAEAVKKSGSFEELNKLYEKSKKPSKKTLSPTAIRGRNNIYSKLSAMISEAASSVLIVSDEAGIVRKSYELDEALRKAKGNGVNVKMVSKFSRKDDKVNKLKKIFELKDSKNVDMRFVVVDDKIILFTSSGDEAHPSNETGVLINSPYIVNAFKNFFS